MTDYERKTECKYAVMMVNELITMIEDTPKPLNGIYIPRLLKLRDDFKEAYSL